MHEFALPATPDRVALTEPQREVFLAAALNDEANCAFNESLTVTLRGPVREADLRFALDAVIARHDALRSTISEDGDELIFAPAYSGQIEFVDLRGKAPSHSSNTLQEQSIASSSRDARRSTCIAARWCVTSCFVLSDRETVLLLTAHHIVLDGWSANQLLEEIGEVYSKGAKALTELVAAATLQQLRDTRKSAPAGR